MQVVGSHCIGCGKQITSDFEGRICEACCCPVHHKCPHTCNTPEASVRQPRADTARTLTLMDYYKVGRYGVASMVMVAMGIYFALYPFDPGDPKIITIQDRAIGLAVAFAGVVSGILAYLTWDAAKRRS